MSVRRAVVMIGLGLSACVLAGCGHSEPRKVEPTAAPRLRFGYDRSQPLGYVDRGVVVRRGSIAVHDITYLSGGVRVDAYLVAQTGRHRRPGIVLVHGAPGDRRQLLVSAVALAGRGTVAMTITEPSDAHPPPPATGARALLAQARAVTMRDVVAVRRAADVLDSLPIVDPGRIGYLGWSAGAKTGAFVGASDRRFKALVLLSAGAEQLSAYVAAAPPTLRPLVRRGLGSVNPLRYIALAAPGTLLLEDGSRDGVVPHRALLNMIRAAPPGTRVRWYPAGHALTGAAYRDAFAWLVTKLDAGG